MRLYRRISSGPSRRGRWTVWELALLGLSVVLIIGPVLATGYALVVPTPLSAHPLASSNPAHEVAQVEPTETRTPSPTRTATRTPSPTATQSPTVATSAPAPALKIEALNESGYRISRVSPGMSFQYYIVVELDVTTAEPVAVTSTLPEGLTDTAAYVSGTGRCEIDSSTLRLSCIVEPTSEQPVSITIPATVGNLPNGTVLRHTVRAETAGGESDSVTSSLTVEGTPTATATSTRTPTPTNTTGTAPTPTNTTGTVPTPTNTTGTRPEPTPTNTTGTRPEPTPTNTTGTQPEPTPTATTPFEPIDPTPTEDDTIGQPPEPTRVPPRNPNPGDGDDDDDETPPAPNPPVLPVTVGPVESPPEPTQAPTVVPTPVVPVPAPELPTTPPPPPTAVPTPVPTEVPTVVPAPPEPTLVPAPVEPIAPEPVAPVDPGVRPTLQYGSVGVAVSELQTLLNTWISQNPALGLRGLVVDGVFGAATDNAVRAFQRTMGLPVDGIVGPQTWAYLLGDVSAAPAPVTPPVVAPPSGGDAAQPSNPAPDSGQAAPAPSGPAPTTAPALPAVTTPIPANAPASEVALRFNVSPGAPEAAPGDLVLYTIVVQHAGRGEGGSAPVTAAQLGERPTGAALQGDPIRDVLLVNELPPALEPFAVYGVGMTVNQQGRTIEGTRALMAPGDAAVVVIGARVRPGTDLATITNQASVRYSNKADTIYSNVSELRIVDVQQQSVSGQTSGVVSGGIGQAALMSWQVPQERTASDQTSILAPVAMLQSAEQLQAEMVARANADPVVQQASSPLLGGLPLTGLGLFVLTMMGHHLRVRREDQQTS